MMSENEKDRFSVEYLKFTGVGFEMVASVAIFCLIGYFVDRQWGLSPIGIITGAVVGLVVGFYLLVKETLLKGGDFQKDRKGDGGESGIDEK